MTCQSCNAQFAEGDRFCAECGAEVVKAGSASCVACGAAMASTARFCEECGKPAAAPNPTTALSPQAVAAPEGQDRLPIAGWFMMALIAFATFDIIRTLVLGFDWPDGDPLSLPFATGFLLEFPLMALAWVAIIALLRRARWGFRLAVVAMSGVVVLRLVVFVWIVGAFQYYVQDTSVAGEFLQSLFGAYAMAEFLVLAGLWMSREAFRRRAP